MPVLAWRGDISEHGIIFHYQHETGRTHVRAIDANSGALLLKTSGAIADNDAVRLRFTAFPDIAHVTTDIRQRVSEFFIANPDRNYFVWLEASAVDGVDMFGVVTREGGVIGFEQIRNAASVPAEQLATWFNFDDDGQRCIAEMLAGLSDELRTGEDIQSAGRLALTHASSTVH